MRYHPPLAVVYAKSFINGQWIDWLSRSSDKKACQCSRSRCCRQAARDQRRRHLRLYRTEVGWGCRRWSRRGQSDQQRHQKRDRQYRCLWRHTLCSRSSKDALRQDHAAYPSLYRQGREDHTGHLNAWRSVGRCTDRSDGQPIIEGGIPPSNHTPDKLIHIYFSYNFNWHHY